MKTIRFYRVNERYGEFSNFSPHPVELNGRLWPTAEHYFQSQKFSGTDHEEAVRLAASPSAAPVLATDTNRPSRSTSWFSNEPGVTFIGKPSPGKAVGRPNPNEGSVITSTSRWQA